MPNIDIGTKLFRLLCGGNLTAVRAHVDEHKDKLVSAVEFHKFADMTCLCVALSNPNTGFLNMLLPLVTSGKRLIRLLLTTLLMDSFDHARVITEEIKRRGVDVKKVMARKAMSEALHSAPRIRESGLFAQPIPPVVDTSDTGLHTLFTNSTVLPTQLQLDYVYSQSPSWFMSVTLDDFVNMILKPRVPTKAYPFQPSRAPLNAMKRCIEFYMEKTGRRILRSSQLSEHLRRFTYIDIPSEEEIPPLESVPASSSTGATVGTKRGRDEDEDAECQKAPPTKRVKTVKEETE